MILMALVCTALAMPLARLFLSKAGKQSPDSGSPSIEGLRSSSELPGS
jgi:hypothetical protein